MQRRRGTRSPAFRRPSDRFAVHGPECRVRPRFRTSDVARENDPQAVIVALVVTRQRDREVCRTRVENQANGDFRLALTTRSVRFRDSRGQRELTAKRPAVHAAHPTDANLARARARRRRVQVAHVRVVLEANERLEHGRWACAATRQSHLRVW
jgi:hypothetical protein